MKKMLMLAGLCALLSLPMSTVLCQPLLTYKSVATGFNSPVNIANAGDNRLFIIERGGLIKILNGAQTVATPFLNLTNRTQASPDGGLLSMAFHPNYKSNGFFFVFYMEKPGSLRTSGSITIARYKVSSNPNIADPATEVILMKILKPLDSTGAIYYGHNGGELHFGKDGNLYFTTGDGTIPFPADMFNNSQTLNNLLGKMIRINVDNFSTPPYYTIPKDNPFYKQPTNGNIKREIWSIGLRNPFRFSFDRLNGDQYIGDVGQAKWEEINYTPFKKGNEQVDAAINKNQPYNRIKPDNFGWSCFEGYESNTPARCTSNDDITYPVYVYSHFVNGVGKPATVVGGYVYRGKQIPGLYGYYLASDFFSGNAYLLKRNDKNKWSSSIQNIAPFGITGYGEDNAGEIYATSISTGTVYKITAAAVARPSDKNLATTMENETAKEADFIVFPTLLTTGSFKININKPAASLQVISINGKVVLQKNLQSQSGIVSIDLPALQKGLYVVKIIGETRTETRKIIVQ